MINLFERTFIQFSLSLSHTHTHIYIYIYIKGNRNAYIYLIQQLIFKESYLIEKISTFHNLIE